MITSPLLPRHQRPFQLNLNQMSVHLHLSGTCSICCLSIWHSQFCTLLKDALLNRELSKLLSVCYLDGALKGCFECLPSPLCPPITPSPSLRLPAFFLQHDPAIRHQGETPVGVDIFAPHQSPHTMFTTNNNVSVCTDLGKRCGPFLGGWGSSGKGSVYANEICPCLSSSCMLQLSSSQLRLGNVNRFVASTEILWTCNKLQC